MGTQDKEDRMVTLEEAKKEVAKVCRRLGLLHLAFTEVLTEELGHDPGVELAIKAIEKYGRYIGQAKRRRAEAEGVEPSQATFRDFNDLPHFGMHDKVERVEVDGEIHSRAYGCVMAKVWREYDKEELGRIYCYVDPVSSMAFSPDCKLIHYRAEPDGDEFCELALKPTSEKDLEDFSAGRCDWKIIDRGVED